LLLAETRSPGGKTRKVPIAAVLRRYPDERLLSLGWRDWLVSGESAKSPFKVSGMAYQSDRAWKAAGHIRAAYVHA
jgi:hypothetical protein